MERDAARRQLLAIYADALRAVAGDALVKRHLAQQQVSGPVCVIAIGKAAVAMADGAGEALGARLQRGLLITKHGYLDRSFDARWQTIEAGHPLPDADSLQAGRSLLDFLHATPEECSLLFLISGGASSLVEVLPAGVSPQQLHEINRWLLASGLDIDAMNRVRKRLSAIKAGRLARHLGMRRTTQLLLADVPGSDPRVIGSGLLAAHRESDLDTAHLPLPGWLREAQDQAPPLSDAICFHRIATHLLASNHTARLAAQQAAMQRGLPVVVHDEDFQGDAVQLGEQFAHTILAAPPALHIWGGEATVQLSAQLGRGGRCQHLALAAALALAGQDALLLAAGTDGSDGPGEEAGALVDGETAARGEQEGLKAAESLRTADAGRFLEASGDLLQTGPTGSNVMDLVLGWRPG